MNLEKEVKECKQCEKLLVRVQDGKFDNGKDKRWRDPNTLRMWNGRVCPDCHAENVKNRKRAKVVGGADGSSE